MSLIGSEFDIPGISMMTPSSGDFSLDDDDMLQPVSPKGPAESLFLGPGLSTDTISALALAHQIHEKHKSSCSLSVATEDFASVAQSMHSGMETGRGRHFFPADDYSLSKDSPFSRDPLSQDFVDITARTEDFDDSDMTSENNIDVATHVYDSAKGVWGWGKGVFFVGPFLGLAEGVAGTVVSVVGKNLGDVDKGVAVKLHQVDDGILNPTINAVLNLIIGASDKTQEMLKPIVDTLLKPLGMIKDGPKKDPEFTSSDAPMTSSEGY